MDRRSGMDRVRNKLHDMTAEGRPRADTTAGPAADAGHGRAGMHSMGQALENTFEHTKAGVRQAGGRLREMIRH